MPNLSLVLYLVLGGVVLAALILLWQVVGRGPRRRRGFKQVKQRLAEGAWKAALDQLRKLRHLGAPSSAWINRFNDAEAQCHDVAASLALREKRFEEALDHLLRAAQVTGEAELQPRLKAQAAMLEEVRRLFAQSTHGDNRPIHDLIGRIMLVQSPCREASFWQALCFLRGGETQKALDSLHTARTGEARTLVLDDGLGELATPTQVAAPGASVIDPPLYLGAILLRQGQAKDALRFLTEANRIDGNCPMVTIQLGAAMIAAGGDMQMAVRALQRALGPRGLQQWADNPARTWVDGFPEGRSYVRKLASSYPYVCPLWGADLGPLLQQANLALGQGLYKMGAYQEAADLFTKAIQHGAPSLAVLRGLGLSLARTGKYDEAFKHLRGAHEMEEPQDRVTAGYLALCGALGQAEAEDKPRNVAWAIGLVMQFTAPGDQEWVALINALFAEARKANVNLGLDEQLYLCEHLVSVSAADPLAAQGYHQLQATHPEAVHAEYAWLFCRAAQQHKVSGEQALGLFTRAFADRDGARAFFTSKGWDFDDVEFTFLERAAALGPGRFPEALGPDYPPRGEELLLGLSAKQEQAGRLDEALATAEVLHKLAPSNPRAFDRLAYLHHRCGEPEQALQLLESWHQLHAGDATPLVRFAILSHQRQAYADSQARIRAALERSQGAGRARIAFLGARLALEQALQAQPAPAVLEAKAAPAFEPALLAVAQELLEQCLADDPRHADALWCLAAVRWLRGDQAGLAQHASAMPHRDEPDVRYHFFAGLSRLAAQDFAGVLETCTRVAGAEQASVPPPQVNGDGAAAALHWPTENAYLLALAHLGQGNRQAAISVLDAVAKAKDGPSVTLARALLGSLCFEEGRYEEAERWWQAVDAKQRAAWKLGEPLSGAVFLHSLQAFTEQRYEEAAEKLRSAGRLGWRDRRLGPLLVLALFKAGRQAVYQSAGADPRKG